MYRFKLLRQMPRLPNSRRVRPLALILVAVLLLTVGSLLAQESGTAGTTPVAAPPAEGEAAQVDPTAVDAGQFTKQVLATNVKQVHAVVAFDFDGDGDNDFAATDYVADQVAYFRQQNGQYTRSTLDSLNGAYPLSLGDVNKDNKPDIMAGGYLADDFIWYRSTGGGNFARVVIDANANGAHSIVTGDVDNDGDNDLVTSWQDGHTIAWYENNGGNFTRRIIDTKSMRAKRAEMADMDEDGDIDIVTASFGNHQIAWHENNGNDNFTKHVIDTQARGA